MNYLTSEHPNEVRKGIEAQSSNGKKNVLHFAANSNERRLRLPILFSLLRHNPNTSLPDSTGKKYDDYLDASEIIRLKEMLASPEDQCMENSDKPDEPEDMDMEIETIDINTQTMEIDTTVEISSPINKC